MWISVVLDASVGKPAEGVEVSLWLLLDSSGPSDAVGGLELVAKG
jgi:5-hydroxyisourate hydrolase-like protein (transthyretin family)